MFFYLFSFCLIISLGAVAVMASRNYNNIDLSIWSLVILIPVSLLGYTLKASAVTVADAKIAFCFLYVDSTILPLLLLFSMLKSLGVRVKSLVNMLAYLVCLIHLTSIWYGIVSDTYYTSMTVEQTYWGSVTRMVSGPLKSTHYVYLIVVTMLTVGMLIGCFVKKKDCSRQSLIIYSTFTMIAVVFYVLDIVLSLDFSLLPFLYAAGEVVIAIKYEKIHSHDMDCVVVEQKSEKSQKGYVAFDLKKRLLCYNDNAINFIPELKGKRIDAAFDKSDERLCEVFYPLIEEFKNEGRASRDFSSDDMYFRCTITDFNIHKGGKPMGFLCEIQDTTAEQGYMNLIKDYGRSLEKDVAEKTEHIRFIQHRIVMGLATIIENRDMNTGGHVKRTSDVIKILVDEMRREGIGNLDEAYADEIIRSSPMHDLGKISIDDKILNKPGKLTDEEYAVMKTHSAKSGEIVKSLLAGVEEPHFVQTAYCLARFHHERWDGKGYPERLMETEIPLEARIMAVADVYDALVSKRAYKEPMSFEKAAEIILDGMGTQFDPMMKPVFENSREQLEAYYKENRD